MAQLKISIKMAAAATISSTNWKIFTLNFCCKVCVASEMTDSVVEAVELALNSAGLGDRYASDPATLSGGERARVSLLRALLAEPQALLLDEPFSRLDKALRTTFRAWVFDTVRARNIPVVLVTHDEDDIPPAGEVIEISRWQ